MGVGMMEKKGERAERCGLRRRRRRRGGRPSGCSRVSVSVARMYEGEIARARVGKDDGLNSAQEAVQLMTEMRCRAR